LALAGHLEVLFTQELALAGRLQVLFNHLLIDFDVHSLLILQFEYLLCVFLD
jgi:hypothetical protein